MSPGLPTDSTLRRFVMRAAAFRRVVAVARQTGGGILDPLFQIVRHCSLKFGCLVWVMVWVMEQAERID
jgi:hypothetical protein